MGNDSKDTAGVDDTATSLKNLVIVAVASFGITQLISYLCDCGSVLLHATAAFTILLQLVVYGHASGVLFGNEMTERFYDLTGSLTFISAVLLSAHWCPRELTERQQALIKLVILWAVRLGLFLFTRIQGAGGHDSRFVKLKRNRYRFAIPWIIQGVWVFLTALPIFILNANAEETGAIALTALDYCGLAVWAIGFVIEVVADMQKYLWKRNTVNHNKFINTGLWRVSRHPNYFGEMLLWAGFFVIASGSLQTNLVQMGCALLSPLFVCFLLLKISGIPLLESAADKKWGDDASYKQYKANTSVLIPFVGRK